MIKFYNGDLLTSNAGIIAHQVNCKGVMGAGLAKQIKERYPKVFKEYKKLCDQSNNAGDSKLLLGVVQFIEIDNKIFANCFSQWGYNARVKQTQEVYFEECMKMLLEYAQSENISNIAIPYKMGCGLAGGDWDNEIFPIIKSVFESTTTTLEIWKFN